MGEIRNRIPGICLRTTLIAGFPGETRDDVEELKPFCNRCGSTGWASLPSHEEGTSAYGPTTMCRLNPEERAQEIAEVQQEISLKRIWKRSGRPSRCLIDKKRPVATSGVPEFDSVEVDNEVIVQSKRNRHRRICSGEDHQSVRLRYREK